MSLSIRQRTILPTCLSLLAPVVGAWSMIVTAAEPAIARKPAPRPTLTVYKLPSCTCCRPWIRYIEANGFEVEVTEVQDMEPVRSRFGVPRPLRGCHTATADGYVFEGHLTAEEVREVLSKRPAIKGLFVPGMPKGAPGMEAPTVEHYEVIAVDREGTESVYAVHNPDATAVAQPLEPEPPGAQSVGP